jgi:adenosylmethionine-8-amino-7-oxononanoate aminotransferase
LANVQAMGTLLSKRLRERLENHPNVGDIRGRGLFWGIEFVANKEKSLPFPAEAHVALDICERGLAKQYSIGVYPGTGSADGIRGDHIIIAPAYNVHAEEIEWIVETVGRLIDDFFAAGVSGAAEGP